MALDGVVNHEIWDWRRSIGIFLPLELFPDAQAIVTLERQGREFWGLSHVFVYLAIGFGRCTLLRRRLTVRGAFLY